jgi:hypothetical protein
MEFSLTEEQELLQETLRGFVAKECPPQTVHAVFDGQRAAVSALWKGLVGAYCCCAELGAAGWIGVPIMPY